MSFDPMSIHMRISTLSEMIPMSLNGQTIIVPGDTSIWRKLLTRTLKRLDDDMIPIGVTSLSDYLFQMNEGLTDVSLTEITSIGEHVFYNCSITNLYMPNLESAGMFSFSRNPISTVVLPKLEVMDEFVFAECPHLKTVDTSNLTSIRSNAFFNSYNLDTIIFRNEEMVPFQGNSPYVGTKIEDGTGYFYVKESVLNDYLNDQGWAYYSDQIRAIENYSL